MKATLKPRSSSRKTEHGTRANAAVTDRVCERFAVLLPNGCTVVLRVHTEQPLPIVKTPHRRAPSAGEFLFALHALSPNAQPLPV